MHLYDVNVLVYAHRSDLPQHVTIKPWFDACLASDAPFGINSVVLSGFLRLVTNPKVFVHPTPLTTALAFADGLRQHPRAVPVEPGPRHWDIFTRLCRQADAKANLIPDAWFAALAIESGNEWITNDRDYARFQGLSWKVPVI